VRARIGCPGAPPGLALCAQYEATGLSIPNPPYTLRLFRLPHTDRYITYAAIVVPGSAQNDGVV